MTRAERRFVVLRLVQIKRGWLDPEETQEVKALGLALDIPPRNMYRERKKK